MNVRNYSALVLLLAASACTPTEEDPIEPALPCDDASGNICTWIGIPQTAIFAAEGLNRLEAATYLPQDGVFGPDGRFYFIDFNNHRIRRVEADDTVTTVAGSGFLGDGIVGADGLPGEGPALDFAFNHPTDLAFHPLDDTKLYVSAWHNSRINVIDLVTGTATFECGTGARSFGGDGGPALTAALDLPASLVFEPDGQFYIMDQANQLIRHVDLDHVITTYAGIIETRQTGTNPDTGAPINKTAGWPGYAGDGGPVTEARFFASVGQAADPSSRIAIADRDLYIADTENHVIRRIDLDADTIHLFAGKIETRTGDNDGMPATPETTDTRGWPGYEGDGGDALEARFNGPRDVEVGPDGSVYVADTMNHCVRKIAPDGVVSTIAGQCGVPGFAGDGAPATEALLYRPFGLEIAPDGAILIADTGNQVFRRVSP
jgi:sugar lactone lactonase YvrE